MTTSDQNIMTVQQNEPSPQLNEDFVYSPTGEYVFSFLKTAFWSLVVVLIVTIGNLGVIPRMMGYTPLTVYSPSMEPTMKTGDLIWVDPTPQDYTIGDIVSYYPHPNDKTLYTHRIVGLQGSGGYVTKGDNNAEADDPILPEQVAGKAVEPVTSIIRGRYTIPAYINDNRILLAGTLGVLALGGYIFGDKIRKKLIWKKLV